MAAISRRAFMAVAGGAGAATLTAGSDAPAPPSSHAPPAEVSSDPYRFLNPEEARFIEAAVARLIPADATGPGAIEAGVPAYIDGQLAGAWGAGERLYRSGPWRAGTPSQGYQLPFTPAELFRHALRGIEVDMDADGRGRFGRRPPGEQEAYLRDLESSDRYLDGVPARVFFEALLAMTVEGFFCDPLYGGNRGMIAWKLIGFPGAHASYYEWVDRHGERYDRPPTSIAGAAPHASRNG